MLESVPSVLHVELAERRYPIHIGDGIMAEIDYRPWLLQPRVVVVTNTTVAPLYLEKLSQVLKNQYIHVDTVILPDGESFKNMDTLNLLLTRLLELKVERKTTLMALGGGVIGDIVGFAAAVYLRGIPFIQIPTTLLAQVDSSVGGKTAVNHPLGKNMIGVFYQPKAVVIDTSTLKTLPARELSAGLAEVIKYGLIRDVAFLDWIESHSDEIWSLSPQALAAVVYRSCWHKAQIVAEDESEQGVRALLNLGHTFGHAIEAAMGYGVWLHGEAVAAGTVMAATLSARAGWLSKEDVQRIERLMQAARLPIRGPSRVQVEEYLSLMQGDKKVEAGQLRLILLKSLGEGCIVTWQDRELLEQVISACTELSSTIQHVQQPNL